jgi:hypothetical protein
MGMERLAGLLLLMDAGIVVEEASSPEDIKLLGQMGCKVAYGPQERRVLSAVAA